MGVNGQVVTDEDPIEELEFRDHMDRNLWKKDVFKTTLKLYSSNFTLVLGAALDDNRWAWRNLALCLIPMRPERIEQYSRGQDNAIRVYSFDNGPFPWDNKTTSYPHAQLYAKFFKKFWVTKSKLTMYLGCNPNQGDTAIGRRVTAMVGTTPCRDVGLWNVMERSYTALGANDYTVRAALAQEQAIELTNEVDLDELYFGKKKNQRPPDNWECTIDTNGTIIDYGLRAGPHWNIWAHGMQTDGEHWSHYAINGSWYMELEILYFGRRDNHPKSMST